MKFYQMTFACLCVLSQSAAGRAESNPPPRLLPLPPSIWKPGDTWPLVIEYSSPEVRAAVGSDKYDALKSPKPARYEMAVIVVPHKTMYIPAWDVKFLIPRKNAPPAVGKQASMTMRKQDGSVVAACVDHFEGPVRKVDFTASIKPVGEVEVIAGPPEGFPMDVFFAPMDYDQSEFVAADARLTIKKKQYENTIVLEAIYKPTKGDELRVRQVWMRGEKWWRDFERYRGGQKELHAWIPDFYFAKQKQKERRKATLDAKSQSGVPATQRPPPIKQSPPAREDERELRGDSRLGVSLNLQLKQPTVEQIMQQLRTAIKIPISPADGFDTNKVAFGSLSLTNVPAWQVMMKLATCPAVAGRWEKADVGYRLFGAPPPPPPPTKHPINLWVLTCFLSMVLFLIIALLLQRPREEKNKERA